MTPKLAVDAQVRHDILVGVRKAELGRIDTEPTPVQLATLDMIRAFVEDHGYPPSMRQIADATECGLSTVPYRLSALIARGYLRREPGPARTLVLVKRRTDAVPVVPAEACSLCGRAS